MKTYFNKKYKNKSVKKKYINLNNVNIRYYSLYYKNTPLIPRTQIINYLLNINHIIV